VNPELVVLRGVRAVDEAGERDGLVDLVIERGAIARIGRDAATSLLANANANANARGNDRVRVIEGKGLVVAPGFVDLHAHLREPGFEQKEDIASGLRAAAAGGFTDVCVMPNTRPVNDCRLVTELMIEKARAVRSARLHPIGAITAGQNGEALADIGEMRAAGAVAISDDGRCVMSSAVMRRALEYASSFDLPVIQHAEDHALTEGAQMHEGAVSARLGLRGWPRVAEDAIVARDVLLAEYVGARYHLAHASTEGSVRILREAKSRGLRVTAEVTPHHLLFTDASVIGYETACKVNPPLREPRDVEALKRALVDGTIDCIATDHAPHSSGDKECEFVDAAMGMIGLELCLAALLALVEAGELPLPRLVQALTTAPARVVGLTPHTLREGSPADLVVFDPAHRWRVERAALRSKSHNTPLLGRDVKGRVRYTFASGVLVHELET
jgi:dihydroorotase